MTDPIIQSIHDFRQLVRQQADRTLRKEQELAANPKTAGRIDAIQSGLRQRQRDYAAIIRAVDLMEKRYAAGLPWRANRRRIVTMNKAVDKLSLKLDAVMLGRVRAKAA